MLKQQNLKVGKCKKIIAQSKMPQRKPRPWVKFFHRKNFKYIDTYGTNKKKRIINAKKTAKGIKRDRQKTFFNT